MQTSIKKMEDAFFGDFFEAYAEAQRRRKEFAEDEFITRIEKNPYGDGYRIRSIPAEFVIGDELSMPNLAGMFGPSWEK